MDIDPARTYTLDEVRAGLTGALSEVYGVGNPLVDVVTGRAVGSMALGSTAEGLPSTEVLDDTPYAERLSSARTPEQVEALLDSAMRRLNLSIAPYLRHRNGMLSPYLHDQDNQVIGQLRLRPKATSDWSGQDVTHVVLEGGPRLPFDPLDRDDSLGHFSYCVSVQRKQIPDPLTDADMTACSLSVQEAFGKKGESLNSIFAAEVYAYDQSSRTGDTVRHVFEQIDAAIAWYENAYLIHNPSGLTYAAIKALGYAQPDGRLLPDWFTRVCQEHPELFQPKPQTTTTS